MLWKNLVVLTGLVWFTTSFAAGKIAAETMDDALGHKIDQPHGVQKSQKRGVANEKASSRKVASDKAPAKDELQYWNMADESETAEQFEPMVEDESTY